MESLLNVNLYTKCFHFTCFLQSLKCPVDLRVREFFENRFFFWRNLIANIFKIAKIKTAIKKKNMLSAWVKHQIVNKNI